MVAAAKPPPVSTDFNEWLASLSVSWSPTQLGQVQLAHETVLDVLPGHTEGLLVADLLADLHLDHEAIAAALLYEAAASEAVSLDAVRARWGETVTNLVDGALRLRTIGALHPLGRRSPEQLEGLRKMILAMARDVRVVLIKLAVRVCQMRRLDAQPQTVRISFARETLDLFAPLANRLGIGQFKWELEDLSLRALDTVTYKRIARALDERRSDRERYIDGVVSQLGEQIERIGIRAELSGRAKHIYSIWRKMQRKQLPFEQIFDVRAVRVLVDSVAECYATLGIVHSLWTHIPQEFDDYIANPKENGYQSLHTAVVGPEGKTLEVQIRTQVMHHSSELGVAAHWRYKEGGGRDAAFERQVTWLRQLLEWKDEDGGTDELLDQFQAELFQDRVYVLTPNGDIRDLPRGATPLDFAYQIHTEVGHRCRGAKVNSRIVPLNYELQNGEQVEILTGREAIPNRNWLLPHLGYLKTSRARAKVRHWLRLQDREKNIAAGGQILEQELRRLGADFKAPDFSKLAGRFNFIRVDDLYAALGSGDLTTASVASAIQELVLPPPRQEFVPRSEEHTSELQSP